MKLRRAMAVAATAVIAPVAVRRRKAGAEA